MVDLLHLVKDRYADIDEVEVVVDSSQLKEGQQLAVIVTARCDACFLSKQKKVSVYYIFIILPTLTFCCCFLLQLPVSYSTAFFLFHNLTLSKKKKFF